MLDFLEPSSNPVVNGEERHEVVYAKDQQPYRPLRTLVSHDSARAVLSRWTPTEEQRQAILRGKDIYLELLTWGNPLQPIRLFCADDNDAEDVKDVIWPVGHHAALNSELQKAGTNG